MRVRLACSLGAVFAGLLGADLLGDVPARLGTTKAALYYHFERKEDILLELHLRLHVFGRLLDELEQLPDDQARLEAWPQMLGRFIEQVAANRQLIVMHQRNSTALHALEGNERHDAENAEFEEQIGGCCRARRSSRRCGCG